MVLFKKLSDIILTRFSTFKLATYTVNDNVSSDDKTTTSSRGCGAVIASESEATQALLPFK
jgi:hypothetical protein